MLPFSRLDTTVPRPPQRQDFRAKYKVGEHIKARRLKLNQSEDDLAYHFDVLIETVLKWEQGVSVPQLKHTAKLIEYLGFDPYQEISK